MDKSSLRFFKLTQFQKKELFNLLTGYKLKNKKNLENLFTLNFTKSKHKSENKKNYEKFKQSLLS